jgi:hypothetical protein
LEPNSRPADSRGLTHAVSAARCSHRGPLPDILPRNVGRSVGRTGPGGDRHLPAERSGIGADGRYRHHRDIGRGQLQLAALLAIPGRSACSQRLPHRLGDRLSPRGANVASATHREILHRQLTGPYNPGRLLDASGWPAADDHAWTTRARCRSLHRPWSRSRGLGIGGVVA